MITETGMVYEKFMISASLMTDAAMRGTLTDMGRESGCTPGTMVLLSRLAKQFYRHADEELLGMQLRHLVALAYVRDHDACPQQDLAEAFCMDANNVVLLLNELEDLGYATRLRDPHDRRRHLVQLTGDGRRALARTERAQGAIEDEVLGALDPAERGTLRQLLSRALRSVEPLEEEPEASAYSATTASIST
jgi:DNA-binding MarR family transcriptional regulator